jgi:hypothetical protein
MRPCHADHELSPATCHLCRLYETVPAYRELWGGPPLAGPPRPLEPRSLPCLFLGEVLDKLGCACPGRWLRACAVHGRCTLQVCKVCPDYQEA